MGIKYTLAETLAKHNLQQKELARESKTHKNIISQLCRNEVIRVNLDMLNRIIQALTRLTGKNHTLKDVMIYVRDRENNIE